MIKMIIDIEEILGKDHIAGRENILLHQVEVEERIDEEEEVILIHHPQGAEGLDHLAHTLNLHTQEVLDQGLLHIVVNLLNQFLRVDLHPPIGKKTYQRVRYHLLREVNQKNELIKCYRNVLIIISE